jgi:hypothetical protein
VSNVEEAMMFSCTLPQAIRKYSIRQLGRFLPAPTASPSEGGQACSGWRTAAVRCAIARECRLSAARINAPQLRRRTLDRRAYELHKSASDAGIWRESRGLAIEIGEIGPTVTASACVDVYELAEAAEILLSQLEAESGGTRRQGHGTR